VPSSPHAKLRLLIFSGLLQDKSLEDCPRLQAVPHSPFGPELELEIWKVPFFAVILPYDFDFFSHFFSPEIAQDEIDP